MIRSNRQPPNAPDYSATLQAIADNTAATAASSAQVEAHTAAIVQLLTYTDGVLVVEQKHSTSDFSIPAGAREVRISNVGFAGGGNNAAAAINGDALGVGETVEYSQHRDPVTKQLLKIPALNIATNGANIWATIIT